MAEEGGKSGGIGDGLFIIGIFVLLFFVWVGTGGPNKPIASGGFALTSPQPINTGQAVGTGALLDYRAPSVIPRVNVPDRTPSQTVEERREQAEAEREAGSLERSPYRGVVSFSRSTSGARRTNVRDEYVRITSSKRAEELINISGWTLMSPVTQNSFTIPFGTELPLSGLITEREQILLYPGDTAYILSGRSPLGASFRTNACIGYFTQYQSFTPSIRNECPRPIDELEDLSGINLDRDRSCEEFVKDIPRCTIASSLPPELSNSCRAFISSNLHYNGCVRNYQNDANFFKNEWRVYLGRTAELWKRDRETIRLYDNEGRLVDQMSY